MVSPEENDRMTRIGPGTPAGTLLRHYWHPLCAMSELSDAEPKRRIRILGENLVLFRDGKGLLGLIAEQCAHRRASLFYGFIEEDGLRCAYHGWKYDTVGRCIEQPFEPSNSPLKNEVCPTAYQVCEMAGLYWGYMGPQPAPLLPRWEVLIATNGKRRISVLPVIDCNWLQIMENSVDTTHTRYLHGEMMKHIGLPERGAYYARPIEAYDFEVVKEENWAGIRKVRVWGSDRSEREIGHPVIFPCTLLVPQAENLVMHFRVPIDDLHTRIFRIQYTPGTDSVATDLELPPVDYVPPFKDENGAYFLGTFASQDAMAWETEGPIMDRTKELLGTSDLGVVLYRRMLLAQIALVESGDEPIGRIHDPAKNPIILIPVSEGQARMAREMKLPV